MLVITTMTVLAGVAATWLIATPPRQATTPTGPTDAATASRPESTTAGGVVTRRVRWDPNTEADLAGYVVSWGDRPGVYTQSKRVDAQITSTDVEVAAGTSTVYVAIRAVDRAGALSGYSNEIALGQAGRERSTATTVTSAKPSKSAEEKAEARRKRQERRRLNAERAKLAKP